MTINPTSFYKPGLGPNSQDELLLKPAKAFATADSGKNGGIDKKEARGFLRNLGYTDVHIKTVLARFFPNGKTSLNRAEFDYLLSTLKSKGPVEVADTVRRTAAQN